MALSYKRILITGANGLLGQKLTACFAQDSNYDLLTSSRQDYSKCKSYSFGYIKLDITDTKSVKELIWNFEPDVIINAGAYTNVDGCEREKELSWKINVSGVENLVNASRLVGSRIVHISTDYIFDGKHGPYDERTTPNPLSYYGRGKLASENVVRSSGNDWAIVRTMVVYGVGYDLNKNFATWLVGELSQGNPVTIVDDQIGNSTLVDDLANGIYLLVKKNKKGIYNIAGSEIISRYDFAVALAKTFDYDPSLIKPIKTRDLNQLAPRPLNSGLITLKAESELGYRFLSLKESLRMFKSQYLQQTMH